MWVLSWIKALVAFATISVPKFIYAVLSYSMTLTVNARPLLRKWGMSLTSSCALAKLLVICTAIRRCCCCSQLLDPVPLSEQIHTTQRATPGQGRRARVAPRREHPGTAPSVPQLLGRVSSGSARVWVLGEASQSSNSDHSADAPLTQASRFSTNSLGTCKLGASLRATPFPLTRTRVSTAS